MRKLLPTLAILAGFALACGGGDSDDKTTTDARVITVQPQAPAVSCRWWFNGWPLFVPWYP